LAAVTKNWLLQPSFLSVSQIWQWHERIRNDVHTSNGQAALFVSLCTWRRDATALLDNRTIYKIFIFLILFLEVTYIHL